MVICWLIGDILFGWLHLVMILTVGWIIFLILFATIEWGILLDAWCEIVGATWYTMATTCDVLHLLGYELTARLCIWMTWRWKKNGFFLLI